MIIVCINCNKKFNVDSNLIPSDGRQIQCGSCGYNWYYKSKENPSKTMVSDKIVNPQEFKKNDSQKFPISKKILENSPAKANKQENYIGLNTNNKNQSKINFFSYLLVLVISFVALLILLDTLKSPLINIFPQLEIILFNFFETLKDIKLFIIDLI